MSDVRHVVPRNDLIEHELSEGCICGPSVRVHWVEDLSVVIHHSLDGRELTEPGRHPV